MSELCIWTYDKKHHCYDTECGQVFQFEHYKVPAEYNFCPYCGKLLEEK